MHTMLEMIITAKTGQILIHTPVFWRNFQTLNIKINGKNFWCPSWHKDKKKIKRSVFKFDYKTITKIKQCNKNVVKTLSVLLCTEQELNILNGFIDFFSIYYVHNKEFLKNTISNIFYISMLNILTSFITAW